MLKKTAQKNMSASKMPHHSTKLSLVTILFGSMVGLTACQSLPDSWRSTAKPEPRYIPNLIMGQTKTLLIAPKRFPCSSVKPMQCMLATIDGGDNGSVFQLPYNAIEGFDPQPNRAYKINARPLIDQNNGQATGQWKLDTILSQKVAK